jgi:hypothetical protein
MKVVNLPTNKKREKCRSYGAGTPKCENFRDASTKSEAASQYGSFEVNKIQN